jgi:hypothetical protein
MTLPLTYKKYALQIVGELKEAENETNWDRRNRFTGEQYCQHGVNVGTWDGPDYMCGACEDGLSIYQYALYSAYDQMQRDRRAAQRQISDAVIDVIKGLDDLPFDTLKLSAFLKALSELKK